MDEKTLVNIAKTWSDKATSGEWARILLDADSYVNEDLAYDTFQKVIDLELKRSVQSKILDIGCGTCDIWSVVQKYCSEKELYGIDLAEGMINIARRRYPLSNLYVGNAHDVDSILNPCLRFSACYSRGVLMNHLGIDYFQEILEKVYPYIDHFLAFDFLNRDWFTKERRKPNKPLYMVEEVCTMIQRSQFKGAFTTMHDVLGREPIVVIRLR